LALRRPRSIDWLAGGSNLQVVRHDALAPAGDPGGTAELAAGPWRLTKVTT
jgi:hypothetical protein